MKIFLIGIVKTVGKNVYILLVRLPVVTSLLAFSHCSKKITCTWVSAFKATSHFCIFSHVIVKLRENGWPNFQPL